jgi:aspartate kinase
MSSPRAVVVQKYGGSSVADPERLRQVARRVVATKRLGHDVVVVVSAMGKTTDQLLALSRQITDSPDRRELDMLLSAGERISMALLTMAIREEGEEAISFTGSQAGILTNDRHVDARIIEVRPIRVQDELARGRIVIVAGFQGMSYKREITCLGRGGSDTTAVALAAALGAAWCEICSDVDGVYSADPRVVPGARRIPELSYEETQELAEAGAKVLNAQAVEFAKRHDIAIYARATAGPLPGDDPTRDGTVVRRIAGAALTSAKVAAVTAERGIHLIRGTVPDAGAEALGEVLDAWGVEWKRLWLGPDSGSGAGRTVTAVVARENLHDPGRFRDALRERFGESVRLIDGFGTVSAVGSGLLQDASWFRRGGEMLAASGLAVQEAEAASTRLTWILPEAAVDEAQRTLHEAWIEAR